MESPKKPSPLPATHSGPRPADFPLGSVESRAAARAMMMKPGDITTVVIWTGLPSLSSGPPIVTPPYYVAPDDSIVQVSYVEYERGKFTAFIDQTWEDGSVYEGDYRVNDLADLPKLCRPRATATREETRGLVIQ